MTEVYVGMCADILHEGHIRLLRHAAALGRITVGLITDEAVAKYKALPILPYSSRKAVVESLRFVEAVVAQEEPSPVPNLLRLRPDVFVHGDDWQTGSLLRIRMDVIAALSQWGGRLEEVPYTPGISSTTIKEKLRQQARQQTIEG